MAVDPTGKFAYVANPGSNNVSGYTINATTGALTAIAGSPFPAGASPFSVAVDPTGKFAYVANESSQSNNVSGYTINATTGALTAIAGSPFPAGAGPVSVAVDPTGKFAMWLCGKSGFQQRFGLHHQRHHRRADRHRRIALSCRIRSGFRGGRPYRQVRLCGKYSNNVSGYTINATTGALTAIAGSPFPAGSAPRSVAVDPTGKFAYVANSGSLSSDDRNVSGYTINATTGALTAIAGSPVPGVLPISVAFTACMTAPAITDISDQFKITRSGFRFNNATQRFVQALTLQPLTLTPIQLPLSLVLDNLSPNATLSNRTGITRCAVPAGSPFINVTGTSVVLEFTNPTNAGITYNTRVLEGNASR